MSDTDIPDHVAPGEILVTYSKESPHVGIDWDGDGWRWLEPEAARELADTYDGVDGSETLVQTLRDYADRVEGQ